MKYFLHKLQVRLLCIVTLVTALCSCTSRSYKEKPYGGMNGRVQEVVTLHRMPEMWFAGNTGTDVMYRIKSVYDVNGYEVCSALMDSIGRIQTETESLFEQGVCIRSSEKAGGVVRARLNLVSNSKGLLEYNKEMNGRVTRMSVKEKSWGRRYKSVISEDGVVKTESVIRVNSHGNPISIVMKDFVTQVETKEINTYDDNQNIIEKHITSSADEKEEIVYTDYYDFDEYGNWTEARTFNRHHLPVEVIVREIKYWK